MAKDTFQASFFSRYRKLFGWLAGLFLLYLVVGFLVVPRVIESVAKSQVQSSLEASLELERVAFNPLTLRMQLEGLALKDSQGSRIMALEQGRFALSLKSVLLFAGVLREVDLQRPELFVTRTRDGELNVLKLIPNETNVEAQNSRESQSLPRLGIASLKIRDGRIEFSDESLTSPFRFGFHPIDFELNDFTTFREEGNRLRFSAEDFYGGSLVGNGSFSPQEFTAALELELQGLELPAFAPYITEFVDIDLRGGQLSFTFQIAADASRETDLLRGSIPKLEVNGLEVFTPAGGEPLLSINRIALGRLDFGAFEPWLELDSLSVSSGYARLVLLEDRSPEVLGLIAERPDASTAQADDLNLELPLSLRITGIEVEDFELSVLDRSLVDHPELHATIERMELRDLSEQLDKSIAVNLNGTLLQTGSFAVSGQIAPLPLMADLEFNVAGLPLYSLNPWVAGFSPATLASGTGFAEGSVVARLRPDDSLPDLRLHANTGIDSLTVEHAGETLAGLESLNLSGITFVLDPLSVEIATIDLRAPRADVLRYSDGQINLLALLAYAHEGVESHELGGDPADAGIEDFVLNWKLGQLNLSEGNISFSDDSVHPGFSTRIENIQLVLSDLRSEAGSRAGVSFSGRFADAGTVEAEGVVNANPADLFADLKLNLAGFGLPATSGYSSQFVGRAIDGGRLDLSIEAKVEDESLSANNAVLVRNLALGSRTEHPDALNLPLDLAVSLLRNRRGEISLNIPLSGRIDDPQFSVASVAGQAFSTVIGNIVSSPFSILGNLVGSRAEELSQVRFGPGSAQLPDSEREPIADLSEALYQRPALQLEIMAFANRNEDRLTLAKEQLKQELKEFQRALAEENPELAEQNPWESDTIILRYYESLFGPIAGANDQADDESSAARPSPSEELAGAGSDDQHLADERGPLTRFVDWLTGRERGEAADAADVTAAAVTEDEPSKTTAQLEDETVEPHQPDTRDLQNRLLDRIKISDERLLRLGRDRADVLRAAFVDSGRVEAERIHIGNVQIGSEAKAEFEVR